jgi:hypothetical protein
VSTKHSDAANRVPPKREEHVLKHQLDRIELKVKRVALIAAALGILVTVLNLGLWAFQLKLTRGQAQEQSEKNRVNLGLELTPLFDPANNRQFWVQARFINHSFRQVTIAMIGIRIWKDWSRETNVHDTPDKLIYSDNRVNDCSKVKCPEETPKSKLALLDREIVVTPNVTDYTENFGPYELSTQQAPNGFWLEGWVYTKEQDDGECAIVASGTVTGAFPVICREAYANSSNCETKGGCKVAYSAARPFKFTAK